MGCEEQELQMPGFLGSVYIFIQYLCPNASLLPQLSHLNMGEPCLLKGTEVLMVRGIQ